MQGGNPPDSFQVHAGHELIDTWVVAGAMEPITFIFEENGFLDKYPKGVIDIISYQGEIYSVPVNIHRSNVLWYNKKVFDQNGLTPPRTFDEFVSVAETLAVKATTPFALGDNRKCVHQTSLRVCRVRHSPLDVHLVFEAPGAD